MSTEVAFRTVNQFVTIELNFWDAYGIPTTLLSSFNIVAIDSFVIKGRQIERTPEELIFGYRIGKMCFKVYRPLHDRFKFSWIGNKPDNYIFGFNQLPIKGKTVIITGGEKDALTLHANGFSAISLNSETANIPLWLVNCLQPRFDQLIVLYDKDETGIKRAKEIQAKHKIQFLLLPDRLCGKTYGKDISDWFLAGKIEDYNVKESLEIMLEQLLDSVSVSKAVEGDLLLLLNHEQKLKELKSKPIEYGEAILYKDEEPIMFPNSILVIQGKAGTHKSRMAEVIAACLIQNHQHSGNAQIFGADQSKIESVVYIDTERNIKDQFPAALQRIEKMAGYGMNKTTDNFRYTSLIDTPREERIVVLEKFIENVRSSTAHASRSLIVILDVLTDCLYNFNDPKESLKLIDLLNKYSNQHGVSFICLIHENPGINSKARGHLGTELINKATTVLQVSMATTEDSDNYVKVAYLKCRNTKKFKDFFVEFDNSTQGLRMIPSEISDKLGLRGPGQSAPLDGVIEFLETVDFPITKSELFNNLKDEFNCGIRTLDTRIKTIIDDRISINLKGAKVFLTREKDGNSIDYYVRSVT
jgi:hypothetical protein